MVLVGFSFRYFLHQWPSLCIFACGEDSVPVGTIVAKVIYFDLCQVKYMFHCCALLSAPTHLLDRPRLVCQHLNLSMFTGHATFPCVVLKAAPLQHMRMWSCTRGAAIPGAAVPGSSGSPGEAGKIRECIAMQMATNPEPQKFRSNLHLFSGGAAQGERQHPRLHRDAGRGQDLPRKRHWYAAPLLIC